MERHRYRSVFAVRLADAGEVMNIDEMYERLSGVEKQIESLCIERTNLRNAIAEARSEFRIGDVVEYKFGRGVARGVVKAIIPWAGMSQSLVVSRIRKDGSEGVQETVYPYKKPVKA